MPPTQRQLKNRLVAEQDLAQGLPQDTGFDNTAISSEILESPVTAPTLQPFEEPTIPEIEGLPTVGDEFRKATFGVDEAQQKKTAVEQRIEELGVGLEKAPERIKTLEEEQEIGAKRAQITDLESQLQSIIAQQKTIPLQLQEEARGRGITAEGLRPLETARLRTNAIRALGVSATLQAAQGNLATALDLIDRQVELEFGQKELELERRREQLDLIREDLSIAEKKRADALDRALDREEQEIAEQKQTRLNIQNMALQAAQAGADAQTIRAIQNARSIEDATIIAQQAGVFAQPGQLDQFTLGKDQIRFDEQGNIIARGVRDTTGVGGFASSVEGWANILQKGQGTIANVPQGIRNKVVDYLNTNDVDIRKQLSDGAIKDITQSESAINNLEDLREVIQSNLQFIGPISGLSRFNPWSDARKAQADIDRVRQTVGKALEGGVLRKEDEVKYKKILATLADTPETALYKIDALTATISRDIQNFKEAQAGAGRFIEGAEEPTLSAEEARAKYNY